VATGARNTPVGTLQRILGLLAVVENDGLPFLARVALEALVTVSSAVNVILAMTCDTVTGHVLVPVSRMTQEAGNLLVSSDQAEPGLVVIETGFSPSGFPVALVTLLPQFAVMDIVRFVATMAAYGSLPVFLLLFMA